jgi:anti-sigma factor RsiW
MMDCQDVRRLMQEAIDDRLPPEEAEEVRRHIASCPPCAAEERDLLRVGETLRLWAAAHAADKAPRLDLLWVRVRETASERESSGKALWRIRKWFWIPAAAVLAVLALLFYPSSVSKAPFHPKSFDVSVEDLESDDAMVALVDKGEDLPRVIWIIENDRT